MTRRYAPEDLAKLSAAERKFIESIESEPKRSTVACSLIQHRVPDRLRVGDALPDLGLKRIDTKEVHRLRSCVGDRPVLLVFGSYT